VSKCFRPYEPDQMLLMPVSLGEWLSPAHLAYFISDVVDSLDLSAILARYEGEQRGYPPYHPRMMVKVLLYAYCTGVPSSRRIERRLEEDIAFRVVAANNTPDFRTISDFRKEHLEAMAGLFVQVLKLCQKAGLVKLGHVSLDGTKVKANASKHKAMSYGRMKEEEARLEAEVRDLLRRVQAVDEEEGRRHGKNNRGDELPRELALRESRLQKIREARAALEAEAKEAAGRASGGGKGHPGGPEDRAQRNFTDPDSRIMPAPGGNDFLQAYNAQVAVDSARQIIVAAEVTNEPVDRGQALPMVKAVEDNTGSLPQEVSADAGYFSTRVVTELNAMDVEPFIPPNKTRHTVSAPPAPRGRIPKALSVIDRMRRKLRTRRGRKRYGLRMKTVEPVLGQIKHAGGFRQFLLRGLEKVSSEWRLICTGHNLLKLFRAQSQALMGPKVQAMALAR
jgi:transposase